MTSLGETEEAPGRLIYRGAEADIFLGEWAGRRAVYKVRKQMSYRLGVIDRSLRLQRTVREATMIAAARRAGVGAPYVYDLSPADSTIVMEYVEGTRMKEAVSACGDDESADLFRSLGGCVARLHRAGIVHGDLTTANAVVRRGELVLLDFGLSAHSEKVEDHAVDLRLIKETIGGAHARIARGAVEALLDGYRQVMASRPASRVERQLRQIERRGRYARAD